MVARVIIQASCLFVACPIQGEVLEHIYGGFKPRLKELYAVLGDKEL